MPLPAIVSLASASGLGGKVGGIVSGILGGGARDDARKARLALYQNAVHNEYSVTGARYMYGQATQNVNEHEKDWYAQAIKDEERDRPDVMAQGRAAGGLYDPDGQEINAQNAIAQEVAKRVNVAVNGVREQGAQLIQNIGAGVTTAATNATAPDGSPLKSSVLIPANWQLIALAVFAIAAFYFLVLKRKR